MLRPVPRPPTPRRSRGPARRPAGPARSARRRRTTASTQERDPSVRWDLRTSTSVDRRVCLCDISGNSDSRRRYEPRDGSPYRSSSSRTNERYAELIERMLARLRAQARRPRRRGRRDSAGAATAASCSTCPPRHRPAGGGGCDPRACARRADRGPHRDGPRRDRGRGDEGGRPGLPLQGRHQPEMLRRSVL